MIPSPGDLAVQFRKGTLEYCVLGVMAGGEAYGLEIVERLRQTPSLLENEGTIYPLLSRLRSRGWVATRWEESKAGPPRRYYRLTQDGAAALAVFADAWPGFVRDVNLATRRPTQ